MFKYFPVRLVLLARKPYYFSQCFEYTHHENNELHSKDAQTNGNLNKQCAAQIYQRHRWHNCMEFQKGCIPIGMCHDYWSFIIPTSDVCCSFQGHVFLDTMDKKEYYAQALHDCRPSPIVVCIGSVLSLLPNLLTHTHTHTYIYIYTYI